MQHINVKSNYIILEKTTTFVCPLGTLHSNSLGFMPPFGFAISASMICAPQEHFKRFSGSVVDSNFEFAEDSSTLAALEITGEYIRTMLNVKDQA